jgi:hypothetical protein
MTFAAAIVLLYSGAAASEKAKTIPVPGGHDAVVVPSNSPVRFASFRELNAARFDGKFVLSGTYTYGDEIGKDSSERNLTLSFTPDPSDAARLPYRKNYGRIDTIAIANEDEFIRAAIPKKKLAAVRTGRVPYVTGRIAIWSDALEIHVECDAQYSYIHFISIYKPAQVLAARSVPESGC